MQQVIKFSLCSLLCVSKKEGMYLICTSSRKPPSNRCAIYETAKRWGIASFLVPLEQLASASRNSMIKAMSVQQGVAMATYLNPFAFSDMNTLMIKSYKDVVDYKGKESIGYRVSQCSSCWMLISLTVIPQCANAVYGGNGFFSNGFCNDFKLFSKRLSLFFDPFVVWFPFLLSNQDFRLSIS